MFYCNDCRKKFERLVQYQKDNKMFQECPYCNSEDVKYVSKMTDDEKLRLLRENKLERVFTEKNNILMQRKECSEKEIL